MRARRCIKGRKAPGMNQHRFCLQGGPRLGGEGFVQEDGPEYALTALEINTNGGEQQESQR
ncbi:hypothetical protein I79_010514 [Cricetulus griseus]|uniref:Uncharacterized protein n=1 Tax=Cricetulus griseus TaxID=10029 RepID=G3HIN9_CRIGR|nr:hypothetical protein I79_010514 [Cricetulus griseus]